ncbi:MAG: hypothetical protein R3C44_22865 [Chloroflexota bacterium]
MTEVTGGNHRYPGNGAVGNYAAANAIPILTNRKFSIPFPALACCSPCHDVDIVVNYNPRQRKIFAA